MARLPSVLPFVAALGLSYEGTAKADEPAAPAADAPLAPADVDGTPHATVPATPVPASSPPMVQPAVANPAGASGAPPAADPDAPTSRATDPRFGDAALVVLSGALSASFGHLGYDNSDNANTTASVEPAFDYFAASSFSLGASALARYGKSTSGNGVDVTTTTVGLTGRIGANLWLADRISFWPRLAVGAWRTWLSYSAPRDGFTVTIDGMTVPIGPSSHFTEDALFVELQAPFLFHVARHFFVGFGPNAYVDVLHSLESASNRRRFVGASSMVGGWF